MKIIKFLLSLFLSAALILGLLVFQFSLFLRSRLYDNQFYISNFEKHNLYSYITKSINDNMEDVGHFSNLPSKVFENIVEESWVREQVDSSVKNISDYMLYKTDKLQDTIDTIGQIEKFNSNLDTFIKELHVNPDKNTQKELDKIKKSVASIVKNQTQIPGLNKMAASSVFQRLRSLLFLVYSKQSVILGAVLLSALLLLLLYRKNIGSFIAWIAYTTTFAGFLILIPAASGIASKFMDNIAVSEEVLKNLLTSLVMDSLRYFAEAGAFITALGGILLVVKIIVEQRKEIRIRALEK